MSKQKEDVARWGLELCNLLFAATIKYGKENYDLNNPGIPASVIGGFSGAIAKWSMECIDKRQRKQFYKEIYKTMIKMEEGLRSIQKKETTH